MPDLLAYILGTSSSCIYVNVTGSDQINCGSIARPCRSLSFAINNVSRHNDKVFLIASPIKQVRYSLENQIVIKHSLTVTKVPVNSLNPVITYHLNMTNSWQEFYAFAISPYVVAPETLTLNIKSVNFNVNILMTFSEGRKTLQKSAAVRDTYGFQLCLSISDSIISSPCHAINFTYMPGYDNVSVHFKNLVIENGNFMFETRKDRCKPIEHIKNTIEMNNVTIRNTESAALSVNGCFNVSIQKLSCSNITWRKHNLFTFKGGVLNTDSFLMKDIIADNDMKYDESVGKTLFLIDESVAEIQNMFIKDIVETSRPKNFSPVIFIHNSLVKIRNMEVTRNSFKNFARSYKSSVCVKNMTLSENNFTATFYSVLKSNMTLCETKFYRNKIGYVVQISSKSSAIMQNNTLTENNVSSAVYSVFGNSTMQLNNAEFNRNNIMGWLLHMRSNCNAIIQNNTLTENLVSWKVYYLSKQSAIQLNNVAFTRNKMMARLLTLVSNSTAIIQKNTLTENYVSWAVYGLHWNSTIQLNNVRFIRNNVMGDLLRITSNSNAIIQNNTLIENNVSWQVYYLFERSTIQLNNVAFTQNRLMENLLYMVLSCRAKLINNTLVRNNNLGRMFLTHSSYLEIDRILIESNTLSQLIWVESCNVSLDSMKIRKNNISKGIVYVENTAGSMNNTYIENNVNFIASAVSITSTYLGKKHFPFEIANIEIIWSHEVPFSSQPIIHLSGTVDVSNVKLLVTSVSEIDVLRYSTEDKIGTGSFYPQIFSSVYNISSLSISCTKANVKYIKKLGAWRCIPCAWGTYTFNNGSLQTSTIFRRKRQIMLGNTNTNVNCLDCPVGANCTVSVKSKNNFYGFKTKNQVLKFLPCPKHFCCTGSQCNNIKSCNKNRVGTLCGRCIKNYVESFLSANCISIYSCQNITKFWLLYCIYALIIATFLFYMKNFKSLMRTISSKMSKMFQSRLKEEETEVEIDMVNDIVGSEEHPDKVQHFTVSGIFALIISFYQIKQLIHVDIQYKNPITFSFITFISRCLNLEIITVTYSSYCPMSNLDAVSKIFIKTYLLTVTLILASSMNYFMSRVFHSYYWGFGRRLSLKPSERVGVCLIHILMLSYKNMTSASLILLNCVEVSGIRVLFIKGDMECFQWWQIVIAVFFFTWVLFFPLSLKILFNMFMKDKISFQKLILFLMIPFAAVGNYLLNRNVISVDPQRLGNESEVKKVLREMFEEPYRLKRDDSRKKTVFYETWRLYQRLLLAVIASFCINPIVRISLMIPIVILIIIYYFFSKPYKSEMYILHWMEVFSIVGIFVCLFHNMFRGFLYVYDINYEYPVTLIWQVLAILDLIVSPIWMLILFFIVKPIYSKVKCKIISFYHILRRGYGRTF